ncbi:hypothetical protein IFM89_007085 [Coptis chinensis]|uniref:DNL-type domain-containing protein n=1 Tax=Coptis chinensis TaxID=261450 RepID=A0A835H1T0_9MAGN|nr:hypothetical protein IFM89_007085 [Coptis chinensis]
MGTTLVQFNTISTFTRCSTSLKTSQNQNSILFFKPSNTRTKLFSPCKLITRRTAILAPIIATSDSNEDELASESQPNKPLEETNIDIKLPRRSLLVKFTCNACGERTERLINRLAYERGTVFVQCAGCLKHHKLIDNLSLVVEYNFLEDTNTDLNA